jgi:hypothetical protein
MLVAGLAVGAVVLPVAPAEARSKPFGSRSLHAGMRGHDVRVLQDFLTRVGIETDVDGQYGPLTARHVRTWERHSERRVNGRMTRPDARVLRAQVDDGKLVLDRTSSNDAMSAAPPAGKATLGSDGKAIAPADAPPEVQWVIAAANRIAGKPYKYGGGHGRWEDSGYDCSGSMSYALHGAGLLDRPLSSGEFGSWGVRGKGSWISVYYNSGHAYALIAGLRLDTSGSGGKGPRWHTDMRSSDGYAVTHWRGL